MTTAASFAMTPQDSPTPLLSALVDDLDIAPSLYEKAAARHTSVGNWLCRPGSTLARFRPNVRPQGSFRFGTVIKPLVEDTSYDLDQVVVLEGLRTHDVSQAELKAGFGAELAAYARAYGMQVPEEKHRCWCLNYRDEVPFHLDSLPSVPATEAEVYSLRSMGVEERWAMPAVAITDDRHPLYHLRGGSWLTSNPRGFARWFEVRAALGRQRAATRGAQASVEGVPPYQWRTPLQRAIQLLKRHRDVMFRDHPKLAPISMIITNLAACAYQGEHDLGQALTGIVERMGRYVRETPPRVPNPTHPAEDYADKWGKKPELEGSFRRWMEQVHADVRNLSQARLSPDLIERRFAVRLTEAQQRKLARHLPSPVAAPAIVTSTSAARIETAPPPWGAAR
ncbi:MAG TPA: nucleotidyltransferase [Gemmatimonadales bacterium]